jgi:hypothetical protein
MNRYKELRTQISKGKTVVKRKAEVKPAEPEKPPVEEKEEEQPVTLSESVVQPSEVAITDSPAIAQDREPDVVTLQEPSVETLAGAVEELKKYIHDEINALKKEIRSLREQ